MNSEKQFSTNENNFVSRRLETTVFYLIGYMYLINACIPLYLDYSIKTLAAFLLVSLMSLIVFQRKITFDISSVEITFFFVLWLCWGIFSLYWAFSPTNVKAFTIKNFQYLAILMFYLILSHNRTFFKYQRLFFLLFTLLFIGISLWEMTSFSHLPSSRFTKKNIFTYIPTAVFTNENDLGSAFVCYIPFLLLYLKRKLHFLVKILLSVALLYFMIVIIISGARLALIASSIILLGYWLFFTRKKTKIITCISILLVLTAFYYFSPTHVKITKLLIEEQIESLSTDNESIYTSSVQIRLRLFKIGYRFLVESKLLGVGNGNFEAHMNPTEMVETGNIFNPHNLFLEIGVNNGIIILLFFIYIYLKRMILYIREFRRKPTPLVTHYIFLGFAFIVACSVSSSISSYYLFWMYLFYFLFGYREMISEED